MTKLIALALLCFACFSTPANARSLTHHEISLTASMQGLCGIADSTPFQPLPASVKHPNSDALFNAIELGKYGAEIERLVAGRQPDAIVNSSLTPMSFAALVGNWKAARTLIKLGANVNHAHEDSARQITTKPLDAAVLSSQFSFACKLLLHGAALPILEDERHDLFRSTLLSDPKAHEDGAIFIEYLAQKGFDVNGPKGGRETPLMGAVAINNIPAIKVLLRYGAKLDIVKEGGRTVWTVAREKNNPQVLKLLKEAQKKAKHKKRSPAALTPATV